MPTIKLILKTKPTDTNADSAVTALLQLAYERFKAVQFETFEDEEQKPAKKGPSRKTHTKQPGIHRNKVPNTTAAGEFLKMAKANPTGRVSLSAYHDRMINLGYADTTAKVLISKLIRAKHIRIEGGFAFLLKEYDPVGLDKRLRQAA